MRVAPRHGRRRIKTQRLGLAPVPAGNPNGNLFSSFKDALQLEALGLLLHDLAQRYVGRYGLASVLQWRFESWNGRRKRHAMHAPPRALVAPWPRDRCRAV